MPGTTTFPAALDSFPAIDANTQESAAGVEHDVVHSNVHAAIAAVQAKMGIDASEDPASIDARVGALETGKEDKAAVVALSIVSGVATMDCDLGRFFTLALNADATLDIVNAPAADCLILKVVPSAGALLTLPAGAALLSGGTYATGTDPHAIGLMTLDAGSSYDVVVAQP